jgi:hypothetical protein
VYTIQGQSLTVDYDPQILSFTAKLCHEHWSWDGEPAVRLTDGRQLLFRRASCEASPCQTGVMQGVRARYTQFRDETGQVETLVVHTLVAVDCADDTVRCELRLEGDHPGSIESMAWPAAMAFSAEAGDGATVLPYMQGTLIPARHPKPLINVGNGIIFERSAYMPMFGQTRHGSGYLAIYDTPFDARYDVRHEAGGDTRVQPLFIPSLGQMRYKRILLYRFADACDHNTMAKQYREYVRAKGHLVTLTEKIARNPAVSRLIGTPIVHEGIATHISEQSDYFKPDDPAFNDNFVPFRTRADQLRALKVRGVDQAYLHLDGWGAHGYDNLHPDPFPPHEAAGGTAGMHELAETCRELGYVFGIHDQYRDYYHDAPTFDMANALENIDGSHPFCSVWYGGPHSWLCQMLAPDYVRRNYNTFRRLGIPVEGAYLDVFSVVFLDECFNPDHPMTRKECAEKRRECFEILTAQGIIPSSEETIDCIVPAIALCHHAPYYTDPLGSDEADSHGIPIPLFNLVYHDCIVIPWSSNIERKGGWGIPASDLGFLHAVLNGGTVYIGIQADDACLARCREALDLHARIALKEMVRHEFVGDGYRRQRTTFADGTQVDVNFDTDEYRITQY